MIEPLYSEIENFIMKTYENYFFSEAKDIYIMGLLHLNIWHQQIQLH